MAVLDEMLRNLDSLTDEELAALMPRLEVEKLGREKEKGVVYDSKGGVAACPHCGSVTIVKTGKKNGKQRYVLLRIGYVRCGQRPLSPC